MKRYQKPRNFYPNVSWTREEDGKRFARELSPKATMSAARRVLDDMGVEGYISVFVPARNHRTTGAERSTDGTWTARDPYRGEIHVLDPLPPRA